MSDITDLAAGKAGEYLAKASSEGARISTNLLSIAWWQQTTTT